MITMIDLTATGAFAPVLLWTGREHPALSNLIENAQLTHCSACVKDVNV
jgi:hypothetical protein